MLAIGSGSVGELRRRQIDRSAGIKPRQVRLVMESQATPRVVQRFVFNQAACVDGWLW